VTTVFDRGTDGPRTHALVIGVGHYPYCAEGSAGRAAGPAAALARRFTPVTSPPASALALARWLMAEQVDDEIAPLGSVEVLASPNATADAAIEAPTHTAVRAAVGRWYERCDADPDNVAMFFFSGHGCAQGGSQFLLLEDLGESPLRFFANSIHLDDLVDGMARSRAGTQCYFVDACREVPDEILTMSTIQAEPLIQPYLTAGFRDAPVVLSTLRGRPAFGTPGGSTLFTHALIQALSGSAAEQPRPGCWEVTTDRLAPTIDRLLTWQGRSAQSTVVQGSFGRRPIRRLKGKPHVPFRLGCAPREALAAAELSLVQPYPDRVARQRAPRPEIWEDGVLADHYRMHALFSAGDFADAAELLAIHPPYLEFDLPVSRRPVARHSG
jgi:Caspase domain